MKKKYSLFFNILIFVLAQIAWLLLLGLWIYWYISNHIIISEVGEKLKPQIISKDINLLVLVGGLIMLVAISFGMAVIFRRLNLQIRLTNLYDNFIANVTHELKSPLASIQMYLETLHTREVPDNKQKEFLLHMMTDAKRLHYLINTILEISAMEQKKTIFNYHTHDADALIRELVKEAQQRFKLSEKNIHLSGQIDCQCVADQHALQIVLNNLVDNSIKYSTGSVNITITIRLTAQHIIITFVDQGIGIPGKEAKKVFHKFHRLYNKKIPSVKGTGLGLYWVREIIRNHGGKVFVSSKGEGKGTVFTLHLPIYPVWRKRYIDRLLKMTRKKEKKEDAL
jgi:two-component system phosphate regulon sensor histidine kinase PhoR